MGFAKGTFHHSEATKKLISQNNARYWLGRGRGGMSGKRHSIETKRRISNSEKGKVVTEETRRRLSINQTFRKGRHFSPSELKRRALAFSGPNNPHWKGGISGENRRIRGSAEYLRWRQAVFTRDDYTCQICGARGVHLEADHVKPFALYPDIRLDINNGRTLCIDCHLEFGWRGRVRNNGEHPL